MKETMDSRTAIDATNRLCQDDNWTSCLDDPAPRSVRWATRTLAKAFNDPDWGKWHYTEGNGFFTACGQAVRPFLVDGSPQEGKLEKITCRRCESIVNIKGAHLRDASGHLI
jgi:hypothetical protein